MTIVGADGMSDLISATAADFRSALEEFEAAWENPNHTRFTLPALQVNSVLAAKYTASSPIRLTREHGLGHGAAKGVGSGDLHSLCCI